MPRFSPRHSAQAGIALIVVMVMLILGSIIVLGATRTSWLNESLVGNESDYSRTYAAAEALIRDAEADIRGKRAGTNTPFNPNDVAGLFYEGSARPAAGPYFPIRDEDLDVLDAAILAAGNGTPCMAGVCRPANVNQLGGNWWTIPATFNAMTAAGVNAAGATYGQFTRSILPVAAQPLASGNPVLQVLNGGPPRAWYWVEVFRHDGVPSTTLPNPDPEKQPFFFRITAIAQGLKPGTQVVLRSVFVPRAQGAAS